MKQSTRWFLILAIGLLLLVGPTLFRYLQRGATSTTYAPPDVPTAAIAATPLPTATPMPIADAGDIPENPVVLGPVVVDLSHHSEVSRNRFQPLSSALAEQGLDLRFLLPTVAMEDVTSFTDFPDQSDAMRAVLSDASALVVVSPYFLYNAAEVNVVERFLSDGGRLLVISDPDIPSDAARDTNSLSAPFNVVFNEDYLYDTVDNDENYVHFFQGGFFDQAENLADSRIAFYGGRSIDGAVVPQVRSASTTLSSLRTGQTDFTTAAIGGLHANNTLGNVLALSDFDVLTDPYVARHDNRRMLEFVVDFLAGGQRNQTIADFPAFLGKEVALIVDTNDPVGAAAVSKASEIQQVLESSGRTLSLGATNWLTDSSAASSADVLYVAHFDDAAESTTLLSDLGFSLETRTITPTATAPPPVEATDVTPVAPQSAPDREPEGTPAPDATAPPEIPPLTPAPEEPQPSPLPADAPLLQMLTPRLPIQQEPTPTPGSGDAPNATEPAPEESPTGSVTPEAPELPAERATGAATPDASAGEDVSPAPTPTVQVYLVRADGIRLLADETQFFIQRTEEDGRKIIAVLASTDSALNAGLTRLLNRDLTGCLIQDELVICPYTPGEPEKIGAASTPPPAHDEASAGDSEQPAAPQPDAATAILVVDDDTNAADGEIGEAELYAALLIRAGYEATLWKVSEGGYPESDFLSNFAWVIWSDAIYTDSGVRGEALRIIGDLINTGGHVTISSRMPFFGVSAEPASPIADVLIADGVPELVSDLPTDPIVLPDNLPEVTPLERNPEATTAASIAMRRGPKSAAADAPVLMLYTDENFEEPKGAKLLLFGMSLAWLPDEVAAQLVENMAEVMLAE